MKNLLIDWLNDLWMKVNNDCKLWVNVLRRFAIKKSLLDKEFIICITSQVLVRLTKCMILAFLWWCRCGGGVDELFEWNRLPDIFQDKDHIPIQVDDVLVKLVDLLPVVEAIVDRKKQDAKWGGLPLKELTVWNLSITRRRRRWWWSLFGRRRRRDLVSTRSVLKTSAAGL